MSTTDTPNLYRVEVVRSPAGEASGSFELDTSALVNQLDEFEQTLLASSVSRRRLLSREEASVRSLGGALFTALFSSIDNTYRASSAVASERGEELQIVLRLDAPELATLPWECMFDDRDNSYVARRQPLVRSVPVASAPPPMKVDLPLRILGLAASPRGLPLLDVEQERENLLHAVRPLLDNGAAALRWLEHTTWEGLQDALLEDAWHVVHFVGHGGFDRTRAEGIVAFEDSQRRIHEVAGESLVDLLREAQPMPRLVVLNACHSSTSDSGDSFSGLATTLVRGGVGAVTAMQFEVSDTAAIAFSRGFYGALGRGRGVDEAVGSGRRAILGTNRDCLEWITPTLYLRGRESRLFQLPASDIQRPSNVDLVEQHSRAIDAAAQDDTATAIPLFDNLLAENPDDRQVREHRQRIVDSARRAKSGTPFAGPAAKSGSGGTGSEPEAAVADSGSGSVARSEGATPKEQGRSSDATGILTTPAAAPRPAVARRPIRPLMVLAAAIVASALMVGVVITFRERSQDAAREAAPAPLPVGPALPFDQMVLTMIDDDNADLWVVQRADAARVRRLTSSPISDELANLSPDRRTVIYRQSDAGGNSNTLRAIAVDGTGDRPLFSSDPVDCQKGTIRHAWNQADPNQLAVTCSMESGSAGYLLRTDGQVLRRLGLTGRDFGDPTFSPDGTHLAFWSSSRFPGPDDPAGGVISVLDMATNEIRAISDPGDGVDRDLAWSPTGEVLAFTRDSGEGDGSDIMTIDPSTGKVTGRTDDPAIEDLPSFSPSGRQIAYRSREERESLKRGARLWLLNLDTELRRPMWSPSNPVNSYRHGKPVWTTR